MARTIQKAEATTPVAAQVTSKMRKQMKDHLRHILNTTGQKLSVSDYIRGLIIADLKANEGKYENEN